MLRYVTTSSQWDLFLSLQVVLSMAEANLDGNGYWYTLKNHEDENDPLVPPTPNQSPHSSFKLKGPRGPGEPGEQGMRGWKASIN